MGLRGPVLAATDLSEPADAALRQGVELARALAARFVVCHVLPEAFRIRVLFPHEAGFDAAAQAALEDKARQALRAHLEALIGDALGDLDVEIESGTAHAGILSVAQKIGAGVIVIGPGPTAHRVARSFDGPVLVARPSPVGGSVLGATDFSDPSLPAIHMAADEARRRGVKLRVVHCLDIDPAAYVPAAAMPGMLHIAPVPQAMIDEMERSALERLHTSIAAAGVDGEASIERLPAALGIVQSARAVATSLIVVGTRGRTGLARLALGSVAESVVSRAECSVLVVPLHPAD